MAYSLIDAIALVELLQDIRPPEAHAFADFEKRQALVFHPGITRPFADSQLCGQLAFVKKAIAGYIDGCVVHFVSRVLLRHSYSFHPMTRTMISPNRAGGASLAKSLAERLASHSFPRIRQGDGER